MTVIVMLFMTVAQAGFLRMIPESHLQLTEESSGLRLQGRLEIKNEGDEMARMVYPEILLDSFGVQEEPRDLKAGESHEWNLSHLIPNANLHQPRRGEIPLRFFIHYQDQNGYQFAVPNVEIVASNSSSREDDFEVEFFIETEEPNLFTGRYHLKNKGLQPRLVKPAYWVPREVMVQTPSAPIEVPAQGEAESSFQFRNQRGLVGSHYTAFLTLEWEHQAERRSLLRYASFQIKTSPGAEKKWSLELRFWPLWIWAFCVGLLGMWIFWIRPLRRWR